MSDQKDHAFTRDEARRTAQNRTKYQRYAPPKASPTNGHNGHHAADTPREYAWNDQGNAERLLDAGGREQLLYVPKQAFPWYHWDDVVWRNDRTQYVDRWMERALRAAYTHVWQAGQPRRVQLDEAKHLLHSLDAPKIASALTSVARHVAVTHDLFDQQDWLLPCSDGRSYDLRTGAVIRSLPEHAMTRAVAVPALDAPAPHPQFDDFLTLLFAPDPPDAQGRTVTAYVRWLSGMALSGYTGEKKFWLAHGETDAGKTTWLSLLHALSGGSGGFAYAIPLRALLKQRQEPGILHDIADAEGKRLIFAEEFRPGDVLDAAWVKRLTGEGQITADRKGEGNRTFTSRGKLIIGTNDLPDLSDVDSALRGRIRVITFPNNIPQLLAARGVARPNGVADVLARLAPEGAAIVYTLVQAFAQWNQHGRPELEPACVTAASQRYLAEQDLLAEWLDVSFLHEPDGALTKGRMELPLGLWYHSFLAATDKPDSRTLYQRFGGRLAGKGFEKRRTERGAFYTGPALTQEAKVDAEARWRAAREAEAHRSGFRSDP